MRLRNALSLSFAAVSSVSLILTALTALFVLRQDRIARVDLALKERASSAALLTPDRIQHLEPRLVAMFDSDGRLLAATRRAADVAAGSRALLPAEPTVAAFDVPAPDGRSWRVVSVPGADGRRVIYASARAHLDRDLRLLTTVFIGTILTALLLTFIVARVIAGRLSRDVEAILGVVRRVSAGELSTRIPTQTSRIAELRRLGAGVNQMVEDLTVLVGSQRTFVSHAAHEIRSPLATLMTELELALLRERSPADYRSALERALGEVKYLTSLAEDLLLLARTREQQHDEPQTTTLASVVEEALRLAGGLAERHGVRVEAPPAQALAAKVRGRPRQLARSLRNLVDNAIAHSPAGGVVRLRASQEGGLVHLEVLDDGPGVAPADAPQLFSPFFRGAQERADELPGAGLGLPIARELARTSGGDVTCDASHQGGARFVLALRLA